MDLIASVKRRERRGGKESGREGGGRIWRNAGVSIFTSPAWGLHVRQREAMCHRVTSSLHHLNTTTPPPPYLILSTHSHSILFMSTLTRTTRQDDDNYMLFIEVFQSNNTVLIQYCTKLL